MLTTLLLQCSLPLCNFIRSWINYTQYLLIVDFSRMMLGSTEFSERPTEASLTNVVSHWEVSQIEGFHRRLRADSILFLSSQKFFSYNDRPSLLKTRAINESPGNRRELYKSHILIGQGPGCAYSGCHVERSQRHIYGCLGRKCHGSRQKARSAMSILKMLKHKMTIQ